VNAGKPAEWRYNQHGRSLLKKVILPLMVFILGLFIAKQFFGIDVEGLAEGFIDFLSNLFVKPR